VATRPAADAFGVTNRIAGRTALVTGAGNGLGRAISLGLAVHGARVVLVGRNTQKLDGVAAEVHTTLGDGAGTARVAVCDAADPASIVALAAELAEEDISILINNAGIAGPVAPLVDITPQDWDAVFAVE
jgi:NAD(P)-dependent dehydrogenase (short-subunit alcohol dehydrogenase family)